MTPVSLKDKAYNIIKDKIIRCEYLPGQVLVESEIVEMIGASRTPIREALNKLEQERLVSIVSKRGVFVSAISVATVCEVYDVRELVEPFVVEKFAYEIPAEKITSLLDAFSALDDSASPEQYYALDNDLHYLIMSHANNSYLQIMMDQIYGQNNRIRVLSGRISRLRLNQSQEEHLQILYALREKDFSGAAKVMLQHLEVARVTALQAITQNSNGMFDVI